MRQCNLGGTALWLLRGDAFSIYLYIALMRVENLLFPCFVCFDVAFVGLLLFVVVDAHKQ